MKSQIRGLLLWASALIEGCSWQERRTEPSNGAGISLRIGIFIRDILLNHLKGIFRQLIKKKKKNQIPFRNPMVEIITGWPECLKKPLDHSDNIKNNFSLFGGHVEACSQKVDQVHLPLPSSLPCAAFAMHTRNHYAHKIISSLKCIWAAHVFVCSPRERVCPHAVLMQITDIIPN